jgi:nucleoside-diphosphate-sugar epimerase
VNVTGTKNLIQALEQQANPAKFLLTSSIALYGDRRAQPLIRVGDAINPIPGDHYGQQKLEAETLVRNSSLEWTIFRLTMITNASKLELDPVMFEIPLNTHMEICQTEDVGYALAKTVENTEIWGKIWNIGGGINCRTTYRDFLKKMMGIFGVGELPAEAFTKDPFCCGFIADADQSNQFLHYQRHSLEDFYQKITKKRKTTRFFARLFRPLARAVILSRSPYYQQNSTQKQIKVKQT